MRPLKNITRILLMLLAISTTAQQGINYKALVKDGGGNVVASQGITVQFIIYKGAALTNNVYQETHTPNTDANGIVIVNIGEGAIDSGIFADINWGNDDHYLNVQINTGGGLTDMGTTQFMAVPYALHAETATIGSNVTGLEALDEGNGVGWRLIGKNPNTYGDIGLEAVDLSYSPNSSSTRGATEDYSIAMGGSTTASGILSTAMGNSTTASGSNSTAMGSSTIAFGFNSTAMGGGTTASGSVSTAMGGGTTASGSGSVAMGNTTTASGLNSVSMGENTTAFGYNSAAMGYFTIASGSFSTAMGMETKSEAVALLAIGRYNIGGGNPTTWVETDNLFEVGNGLDDANRRNAFTILKNGTITAPSLTNSLINTAGNKALITKEYLEANASSGLEAINEGNGIGWRLIGRDPVNYGDIGFNAVDFSYSNTSPTTFGATGYYSMAMGIETTASSTSSTAMGNATTASGSYSMAMGFGTTASGSESTSRGFGTTASGRGSTAMGTETTASGYYSTAMGSVTKAEAYSALAIGRYNVGGGTATAWYSIDKLFEVGNGLDEDNRSNAFTILKNGNVGIGDDTPTEKFEIYQASGDVKQIIESGSGDADLQIRSTGATNPGVSFYDNGVYGGGITYSNTNNHLLIYEGGNFAFKNGDFGVGTITPEVRLQVVGGVDASLNDGSGYFVIGSEASTNIVMDTNEIIARNNGATSNLHFQTNGGDVYVGGVFHQSSDKRLKQDIENVSYGLNEILQLRPVSYRWKTNPNALQKSLGLIAQEVQPLIKDLVSVNENRDNTLALDYNGLIPILVKAIQEQQVIIEKQKNKLDSQKNELNSVTLELTKVNSDQIEILSRLQQLETSLNKE